MSKKPKTLQQIFKAAARREGATGVKPLASNGLTHDHYILEGAGKLLRVPRRNQLGMSPVDYLVQQEQVYRAAAPSGATPEIFGTIPPQANLDNGALVIGYIPSRQPETDADRKAMAEGLAALNKTQSKNIPAAAKPFASQWFVIHDIFGEAMQGDKIDIDVRKLLAGEKAALKSEMDKLASAPMGLIGADSHLGNFIIDANNKAWFVDLEFLTTDVPHIDAADAASPLTSRLDPNNKFVFTTAQKEQFYKDWGAASGYDASGDLMKLAERMVNLRTLAWLCYWVEEGHAQQNAPQKSRDNWDAMAAECLTVGYLEKLFNPPQLQKPANKRQPAP